MNLMNNASISFFFCELSSTQASKVLAGNFQRYSIRDQKVLHKVVNKLWIQGSELGGHPDPEIRKKISQKSGKKFNGLFLLFTCIL